jgi:nicotinate-nucleotide pyrophosphorylase (carboxylating)
MFDLSKFSIEIEEIVERALDEDLRGGDITTEPLVAPHTMGQAEFRIKQQGILAGVNVVKIVFCKVDPFLKFEIFIEDGSRVNTGDVAARVTGTVGSILKGERTALNFLQHLSGIATQTSRFVAAVEGLPVKVLDTRKTTPGLRVLEKYAVSAGGGNNHRLNLGDMVLIKDNHISILRRKGLTIADIVLRARAATLPGIKIEIETRDLHEALAAAEAGADIIMLDNMGLEEMKKAVDLVNHRAIVEASGGVNIDTIRQIAATGVDWISVGALTHSASALDISMKLET